MLAYPEDRFCEACGAELGTLDPGGEGRDDARVLDRGRIAGVSHAGLLHHRNEDALYVEVVDGVGSVAVVCDGVSTSVFPDLAAAVAARSAGATLAAALQDGREAGPATVAAMVDAQRAVTELAWDPKGPHGAPACTYVSIVEVDGQLTIGWVGDSRAYWLGEAASLLTADNSWVREQVEGLRMTPDEAEAHPQAHAITRWLGADAPDGPEQVVSFCPGGRGRVVVCSDGLWNYAPDPDELACWVGEHPSSTPALAVAQSLMDRALDAGGHDNVTVVVVDIEGSREEEP
jgi:serine/threonine protein phosphatase PrpC